GRATVAHGVTGRACRSHARCARLPHSRCASRPFFWVNAARAWSIIAPAMTSEERLRKAVELMQEAYRLQMEGELEGAIDGYRRSIALHPTPEAHTFLGWTYSFQGRLDDAIAECKEAIAVDADFGNPYNDIGSYLIKLGRHDEA